MSAKIGEIKNRDDAERISAMILGALCDDSSSPNPFKGKLIRHSDGTIIFMGKEIKPAEASQGIAQLVWQHRVQLNRRIKRWDKTGGQAIDCGC